MEGGGRLERSGEEWGRNGIVKLGCIFGASEVQEIGVSYTTSHIGHTRIYAGKYGGPSSSY